MSVRVVLADDHPMVRYGIAAVLADAPSVDLVGQAADGEELLGLVDDLSPEVVLTDLAMPGVDGLAAITTLARSHPDLPVLVLTMHADDEAVFAALRAGARGFLVKGADGAELVRAIETVAAGGTVYGPAVGRRISDFFTGAHEDYTAKAFPDLTDREREVLVGLADGLSNRAIGDRLGISEKTVRNHVSAVLLKLRVEDRTAAALRARDAGIGG